MNRRDFICGTTALGIAGAVGSLWGGERPALRFGALSDIHIIDAGNAGTFERALRWYDAQKVDAVLISGDMADWGLVGQLKVVADVWNRVFPGGRGSDGRPVARLFHYGDHDTGLNPATLKTLVPEAAVRERESIPDNDRAKIWEEVFGESWAPIQLKEVKGYRFVLYHFTYGAKGFGDFAYSDHMYGLPEFLQAHAAELRGDKPFFYSQHRVMRGTVGLPNAWGQDDGYSTKTLSDWPNCVAFCGHQHLMATDERSIWQGAFTAVEVPSLSYLCTQSGRENGFSLGDAAWCEAKAASPVAQMPRLDTGDERRALARQGYLVDVHDDCLRINRRDFLNETSVGPDWVVPLPVAGHKPYSGDYRTAHDPAPEFAPATVASARACWGFNRANERVRQLFVTFPAARSTVRTPRAYDYEVVPFIRKGDVVRSATAKRVYSPLCYLAESQDTAPVSCVFGPEDIPTDFESVYFMVTPLNAFGRRGASLQTRTMGAGECKKGS